MQMCVHFPCLVFAVRHASLSPLLFCWSSSSYDKPNGQNSGNAISRWPISPGELAHEGLQGTSSIYRYCALLSGLVRGRVRIWPWSSCALERKASQQYTNTNKACYDAYFGWPTTSTRSSSAYTGSAYTCVGSPEAVDGNDNQASGKKEGKKKKKSPTSSHLS